MSKIKVLLFLLATAGTSVFAYNFDKTLEQGGDNQCKTQSNKP